jgi:hypothetical protein
MAFAQATNRRPIEGAVATLGVSERVAFLRRTYAHLGVALLAWAALTAGLMVYATEFSLKFSLWAMRGSWTWLAVMLLFMVVGWARPGLLARGHLLIEDVPGVGKTTLAHALARTLGLDFHRIQFTSDLLPADILGAAIYDRDSGQFSFHPGPIFAQVILADEINRASPKAQSALLEAMEEGQVSIEGETRPLPSPFFVIATQNPATRSAPSPCPSPSSTASCCASAWASRNTRRNAPCCERRGRRAPGQGPRRERAHHPRTGRAGARAGMSGLARRPAPLGAP